MRPALALLPLVPLAACATGPGFDERMTALVGKPEGTLVETLGVPNRTYETAGTKYLQFEQIRSYAYPPDPFWYGRRYWAPWPSYPAYSLSICSITFATRRGIAESYTARGSCG